MSMERKQYTRSGTRIDSSKGMQSAENAASNMDEFLKALEDIRDIDIDKLKTLFSKTANPESQPMVNGLIIERSSIIESLQQEKEIVETKLEEERKFRKEYVRFFGERKINDLSKKLEDMITAIKNLEKETERLNKNNKNLEEEKQKALEEKRKASARLSKPSDHMTDSYPNIADLSYQKETSRLGERYSALYDNQWPIAFEVLTETYRQTDEMAIQILLNVLIECHNFAKRKAEIQMYELVRAVTGGSSAQVGNELRFHLQKARRQVDISRVDILVKECESHVKSRVMCMQLYLDVDKDMKEYINECFQVCWLMAIQDVPVVMGHMPKRFEDFNIKLYKPYSRSGSKIEFTVWPPLLLHEGGPVLATGVAQPILEIRKEDVRSVKQIRTAWGERQESQYQARFTQTKLKQDDLYYKPQASRMKTEYKTNSAINISRGTDTNYDMHPVKTSYTQTSFIGEQDSHKAPAYKTRNKQITPEMSQNSQKVRRTHAETKYADSTTSRNTKISKSSRDTDHGYGHLQGRAEKYVDTRNLLTH
ncbi:hypothetical protein ACJMK2_030586 [Sinanodonta woodiana]|uniref:Mitochondria-eating protein C-terminal domain-containing protein n=1 Tax=Sinanodonta woodiana TaxID=1069815 RepID=A0ABD3X055_SINWO